MRTLMVTLITSCLCVVPVLALAGNSHPTLYLEIYQYDTDPDDPDYGCVVHGTCPEICGHEAPCGSYLPLQCYTTKLPYMIAVVAVHVGRLDHPLATGWPLPCGPGGGYAMLSCGILRTGAQAAFLGASACPGFIKGPGTPPGAILFGATTQCHGNWDHPFYTKWLSTASTNASYFDIIVNADDGLILLKNCQNGNETPVVGNRAQWGGTRTVTCSEDTIPQSLCAVTPSILDFGSVPVGSTKDTTFTISNVGCGTLEGSVSKTCGDDYSIVSGGGSFTLPSVEPLVVTVRFEPKSAGVHDCTIETGNDLCGHVSCTGVGTVPADQKYPAAAFDGTNYLVVWEDKRSGTSSDIYGARVSQEGVVLDTAGIAISTAIGDQEMPAVAFDGTNYLLVWHDSRGDGVHYDIYGARVTVGGTVLDPSGIAICMAVNDQKVPAVAFDGTNYLVVWEDERSGNDYDIYGARVSTSGVVLDASGIALSTATGDQHNPTTAFDGVSYFVVWEDYRNGGSSDIYGTRVTMGGIVFSPFGIAISTATGDQILPAVTIDPANYLVVWEDNRNGSSQDIYAARVSLGGSVWDPSGIAISTAAGDQVSPAMTFDGTNNLVVWGDYRSDKGSDIYGARVTPAGAVLDANGLAIATAATDEGWPCAGIGPTGQILIAYQSFTGAPYNCYLIADSLLAGTVGVEDTKTPAVSRLGQSYPNPFNPVCTIQYDIAHAGNVNLKVFDLSGSQVRTLVNAWREPGAYSEIWDGRSDDGTSLPSGVYFYSIKAGDFVATRKMVLLR